MIKYKSEEVIFLRKFISYEKLSKKKKKQLNGEKRKNWGNTAPVTRVIPNKKHYNRKKKHSDDLTDSGMFLFI